MYAAAETMGATSLIKGFLRVVAATMILVLLLVGTGVTVWIVSPSHLPFAFQAQLVDQGPSPALSPGASAQYTLRFRNIGLVPWQRGTDRQVNLGVTGDSPTHAEAGIAMDWMSPTRIATTSEDLVFPGMIATFSFKLRAPTTPGVYRVPVGLVVDGFRWVDHEPVAVTVTSDLGFHGQLVEQSGHPSLKPGETSAPIVLRIRNIGARTWNKGVAGQQVNLGITGDDKTFAAYGVGWPSVDRVAIQAEPTVPPGGLATFSFRVRAPFTPGTYPLRLRPVIDGVTWLEDDGVVSLITVIDPTAPAAPQGEATADKLSFLPTFDIAGSVDPITVVAGGAVVMSARFKALRPGTAVVGVEVYVPGDTAIAYQKWFHNQDFTAGQERSYATTWQVPSGMGIGVYSVKLSAYASNWKALFSSKASAAKFTVTQAPLAVGSPPPPSAAITTVVPTPTSTAAASTATGAPATTATGAPTGAPAPTATGATTGAPAPTATGAPTATVAPTAQPTATAVPTAVAAPSFTTSASVAPTSVARGNTVNVTALVQSATALTAVVDIEIYDPGVNQVYQVWFENQAYAAGQQRSYPVSWQVPTGAVVGTYFVKIGVFSPGWSTLYNWNNSGATVMVTPAGPTPTTTPIGTPIATVIPSATVSPTSAPTFTPGPTPAPGTLIPADRLTAWSPGIPGGIPVRTTLCANLSATTYGNGTQDASGGIQAALDACPAGQVVQLSAGSFRVNNYLLIHSGITLRGAGLGATTLIKTNGARARISPTQPIDPGSYSYDTQPIIVVGPNRWPSMDSATSQGLTADGAQGARTVTVGNAAGFAPGQIVLVDELSGASWQNTPGGFPGAAKVWAGDRVAWNMHWPLQQWQDDNSFSDANGPYDMDGGTRVVPHAMSWFSRQDRPTSEMKDIASVSGNTITFTTPLTISYRTNHTAQVTRATASIHVRNAGVEDLSTVGGADGQVRFENAAYSWAKNIEVTQWIGEGVAINSSFRVELRDSYIHTGSWPTPGGAGYAISFADGSSNVLVENNIMIDTNKVMVMRSSGAGSVIGYNYADDGWISYDQGWQEVGINASHMSGPHHVLFEGNYSQNADSDYTHGNAIYLTFYRNLLTGHRRTFTDVSNVRAAGLAYGSWWDSFVGNVLGVSGQMTGWVYEDPSMTSNTASWIDRAIWKLGYDPERWSMVPDPKVLSTVIREGNFDYVTNQVHWSGAAQQLPASLYLGGKPAFFGSNPWPWVDPTGATKLFTLPAKARYDAMPGH